MLESKECTAVRLDCKQPFGEITFFKKFRHWIFYGFNAWRMINKRFSFIFLYLPIVIAKIKG